MIFLVRKTEKKGILFSKGNTCRFGWTLWLNGENILGSPGETTGAFRRDAYPLNFYMHSAAPPPFLTPPQKKWPSVFFAIHFFVDPPAQKNGFKCRYCFFPSKAYVLQSKINRRSKRPFLFDDFEKPYLVLLFDTKKRFILPLSNFIFSLPSNQRTPPSKIFPSILSANSSVHKDKFKETTKNKEILSLFSGDPKKETPASRFALLSFLAAKKRNTFPWLPPPSFRAANRMEGRGKVFTRKLHL